MSDEATMRLRLQNVAAYRALCRAVQRTGRENVVYALFMFAFTCYLYNLGAPQFVVISYAILAIVELFVGLYKWFVPSPEVLILDAFARLAFAGFTFWRQYVLFQNGLGVDVGSVLIGLYVFTGAFSCFKSYGQLRKLFADRPSADHIAWFDDLVREILSSDPHTDSLAIDLPTQPRWQAKLLGGTAFFVASRGAVVLLAGPGDFTLKREKSDHGTGHRRAVLNIYGEGYPEFDIDDASWVNYTKWMTTQQPSPLVQ